MGECGVAKPRLVSLRPGLRCVTSQSRENQIAQMPGLRFWLRSGFRLSRKRTNLVRLRLAPPGPVHLTQLTYSLPVWERGWGASRSQRETGENLPYLVTGPYAHIPGPAQLAYQSPRAAGAKVTSLIAVHSSPTQALCPMGLGPSVLGSVRRSNSASAPKGLIRSWWDLISRSHREAVLSAARYLARMD
jgi:hypothetical protein